MATVYHIATGPNGESFVRSSKSARYTHVVIGRPSLENDRKRAERGVRHDVQTFRDYQGWAANGYSPSPWMVGKSIDADYQAADRARFPEAKDLADLYRLKGGADAREWLADKPATAEEYAEGRRLAAHAAIEDGLKAGAYSAFHALGWSSSLNLASQRFGEFQPTYCDLRAIPCAIGEKPAKTKGSRK